MEFDRYAFPHIECCAMIMLVMNSLKRHKVAAVSHQLAPNSLFLLVELKRKYIKRMDFLHSRKLRYLKRNCSFSETLAIMIQIVAVHIEIFAFIDGVLFFGRDKFDASRLPRPRTSRVNHNVGLEQSPEKVEQRLEPSDIRAEVVVHELEQQINVRYGSSVITRTIPLDRCEMT